jgi:hypothetical protein
LLDIDPIGFKRRRGSKLRGRWRGEREAQMRCDGELKGGRLQ